MHKAFFGDRERDFALTPHLIPEYQRLTGNPIGATIASIRRLSHAEITEAIRLGLIGAGTSPEEAAKQVSTYLPVLPLGAANALAVEILADLWTGPTDTPGAA